MTAGDHDTHRVSRWDVVALALLITAVCGALLSWIVRDTAPISHPNDPYRYLAKSIAFTDHLRSQGFEDLGSALDQLPKGGRFPLYQLLSVPFILAFGRSLDAALAVNVAFEILLLISVYAIGKRLGGGKAGLLAAVLVAAYPPIVHLSHIYRPHFAAVACTALSLWLLLLLLKNASTRVAWLFGGSLAFGLLLNPHSAWALAGPTALFGGFLVLFRSPPRRPSGIENFPGWLLAKIRVPFVTRGLVPAACIALALPLAWFLTRGRSLLHMAERTAARELAFALGFPEESPSFWWYVETAPGALSNVLALFAIIGLANCVFRRRLSTSLLGFALVAGYSTLGWTREVVMLCWWYFAPILPIAAALTSAWIVGVRRRWLARLLALVCAVIAAIVFSIVTWGVAPWARPIALALGAPLDSPTCADVKTAAFCPDAARSERWPASEILGAALRTEPECERGERECLMFVITKSWDSRRESKWPTITNAFFGYHAVRDWPEAGVKFVGYPTLPGPDASECGASSFVCPRLPSSGPTGSSRPSISRTEEPERS
jgi:hypothetical protein